MLDEFHDLPGWGERVIQIGEGAKDDVEECLEVTDHYERIPQTAAVLLRSIVACDFARQRLQTGAVTTREDYCPAMFVILFAQSFPLAVRHITDQRATSSLR